MFTPAMFLERDWIKLWELTEPAPQCRTVYVAQKWIDMFNGLPRRKERRRLDRPPSIHNTVAGLFNQIVRGDQKAKLVRPAGNGSDPVFRRMRPPNQCVVELRTYQTRTFGFFAGPNTFVACRLDLTSKLKADTKLYELYAQDVKKILARLLPSEFDCETNVNALITD